MSSSFLSDLLLTVTDRGRALMTRSTQLLKSDKGLESDVEGLVALCDALVEGRGEATGMAIARDLLDRYACLNEEARLVFFESLSDHFGTDVDALKVALEAWQADGTDERATDLHFASEPRRQELFRRLNRAPGGMAALVTMRSQLLPLLKEHPKLKPVDRDFHHLFSSWFNRGFLVLRRIDWSTPASVLEKIIKYEAVHEIHDWDDLRRRTDLPDRRCFAFFHPALADEPLIFVEVALTKSKPDAIAPILSVDRDPLDPAETNTAVFYSISNCQSGLRGVSFGNFLIKQVVDELARDLPMLKTFVTLSPMPGFMDWLRHSLQDESWDLLEPSKATELERLDDEGWIDNEDDAKALKAIVMPLAAHYFLVAKNARGEPIDPVARFHLGNGARLERLNWLADTSENGRRAAAGLMVNYLYDLDELEKNHEAFANHNEVIASGGVTKLLKTLN